VWNCLNRDMMIRLICHELCITEQRSRKAPWRMKATSFGEMYQKKIF
jgi:hypothetical protein